MVKCSKCGFDFNDFIKKEMIKSNEKVEEISKQVENINERANYHFKILRILI